MDIYNEINNVQATHVGRQFVRKMYDSFYLRGPHGTHPCLVHQPMGMTLGEMKKWCPDRLYPPDLVRQHMRCILFGLPDLHREVKVIHTDLQPSNMMMGIDNLSVLTKFEQWEGEYPCPRKELDDRTIYLSRPMSFTKGQPSITDFSEARFGEPTDPHTDPIMPDVYRAPEVILGLPWSYPVDIWGFGMVLWDLFQPNHLFCSHGEYSEARHLAEMIAISGPPPLDLLRRSGEKAAQNWDENGTWKEVVPIPSTNLESAEKRLEGPEKEQFLAFLRKILQWNPDDRGDWEEIPWDDWLMADWLKSGRLRKEQNLDG